MKKILKMLVLGLLSAALLCCALPSAFAAEDKDSQVYTIGLDAMGGSSSAVAVTTNLSGKLSALPAQPALEGYTFDGWYTEPVGGTKISTSTVFTGDTTVYAHWTVKNATISTSTSTPAQPEQTAQEYDDGPILSVLKVVDGKDYVTLMTCTPYGINTHRLLVRGHRVTAPENLKRIRVSADATRIEPILIAPLLAVPLLLLLLIGLLVSGRKRKQK